MVVSLTRCQPIVLTRHGQPWIRRWIKRLARLSDKPVRQRDKLGSPVPTIRLVCMLDSMCQNAALLIERENEQAGELSFLRELEDRFFAAEEYAKSPICPIRG